MNHCKDCRHFLGYRQDGGPLRERAELFPESNAGECQLTARWQSGAICSDSLAVVKTAGPYKGVLVVHPRFGCIQWEPRTGG